MVTTDGARFSTSSGMPPAASGDGAGLPAEALAPVESLAPVGAPADAGVLLPAVLAPDVSPGAGGSWDVQAVRVREAASTTPPASVPTRAERRNPWRVLMLMD
jgi:hypothetical protein